MKPLLEDASSAQSPRSLHFEINTFPNDDWTPTFSVDLHSASAGRSASRASDLGELDNKVLLNVGSTLLAAAGVKRSRRWDGENVVGYLARSDEWTNHNRRFIVQSGTA
jgi:hypothetical protein